MVCRAGLVKLGSILDDLAALGVTVYGISTDEPHEAEALRSRTGVELPLLFDPERDAVRALGLVHPGGGIEGEAVAKPARVLVDREGHVLWSDVSMDTRIRIAPEEVLAAVREALEAD